jgi:hypothetical protein
MDNERPKKKKKGEDVDRSKYEYSLEKLCTETKKNPQARVETSFDYGKKHKARVLHNSILVQKAGQMVAFR